MFEANVFIFLTNISCIDTINSNGETIVLFGGGMESKLQQVLEVINRNEFTSVKDLTSELGVSRSTTDRYLQNLEDRCVIKRVRGGVMTLQKDFSFCPDIYDSVNDEYFQERILIAQKAVEMIGAEDCVFLGGGRNTLHVARELKLQKKKTTVVTNSLPVALLLSGVCNVNLAGLTPTDGEGIMIGTVHEDFPVNKAFIAPGSVSEDGFYNSTPMIVQLESAFLRKAKKVVMLINTETYTRHCLYKMSSLEEADVVIASGNPPEFVRRRNTTVCCAD